jgi:hypothetical protein
MYNRVEDKRFWAEWLQILTEIYLLLISSRMQFI